MVHYVLDLGTNRGTHRPAVVVRVWRVNGKPQESGLCNLQVFTDGNNDGLNSVEWKTSVVFDAGDETADAIREPRRGTWHWIERA